jgi:hypothetical protein
MAAARGTTQISERRWWLLVFTAGLLVNLPAFSQYHVGINDEAVISLGADRLLAGEFPYRDWDSRFPTGSYALTALLFSFFGVGMVAVRITMLLTTAILGLLLFVIGCRLMSKPWALLAWAMAMSGALSQVAILSYHWIAIIFFLSGILALVIWVQQPETPALVGFAVSFSGACWTLQSEAAALLLTATVVFVTRRSYLGRQGLGYLLGAFLGSSLLLWSYVLVTASPLEVWRDNVANAVGLTVDFNRSPYSLGHLSQRWSGFLASWEGAALNLPVAVWAAHSVSYLLVWTIDYGLFFPVLALGLTAGWRQRKEAPGFSTVVLGLLVLTLICRHRQDMLYLKYLTPLWYVTLCYLLQRWAPRPKVWATLLALVYGISFLFSIQESRTYSHRVSTPRGVLYTASPDQAAVLNALYRRAYSLTPPGTSTAAFPYAPGFLFLSGVKNVIRPPVLAPMLYTREQILQARQAIEASRPEYIYHFPLGEDAVLKDYPLVDPAAFREEYAWTKETLLKGYQRFDQVPGCEIYRIDETAATAAPEADIAVPTTGFPESPR